MVSQMMIHFVCCALVVINCGNAMPTTMERMTVSSMRMADLESSASGYTYNHQPGRPASYVQYTNHGTGGYYDEPNPVQYITYRQPGRILNSGPSVITSLPTLKNKVSPLSPGYIVPLLEAPNNLPLAPYYVPVKVHPELGNIDEDNDDDDDDDADSDEDASEEEHGEGGIFHVDEHSSHGENGGEGYENRHEFDNGDEGEFHNDKDEGHYSDEGGNEQSHSESAEHYGNYDEADEGNNGESYGEQKYHKKGEKTTGFHNVYRKDEYKKDTDFYDEAHKSGHHDKHSSSGEHYSSSDGAYEKGGRHNSGYKDGESGKAGHYDKGHENNHHKGFKGEEGNDSYHENHSDYAAKNGEKGSKKYGYVDDHQ